jgi:putative transcriptional regulator
MDTDDGTLIGRLLVAAPALRDPNFAHTVVLLLDHSADGALGVVLNRPSDVGVENVLPEWADRAAEPDVVFVGGPVQPDAVVGLGRLGVPTGPGTQVLPGLGPLDLSSDPSDQPAPVERVRLFAGYAGWDTGQLESEISAGGWFVVDASAEDAFTSRPDGLWRQVLTRQGGVFQTVPADPTAN